MSRQEPNQNPSERRGSEQLQQAERGRTSQPSNAGHTPTKAEGDERTVDEALRNQEEGD